MLNSIKVSITLELTTGMKTAFTLGTTVDSPRLHYKVFNDSIFVLIYITRMHWLKKCQRELENVTESNIHLGNN